MDLAPHALLKSKPLRFLGTPQGHRPNWACIFCLSQVRAAQATRCLVNALSQESRASLSPPWSWPLSFLGASWEHHFRCATRLLWGADVRLRHSWWIPSRIPGRCGWQLGDCSQFGGRCCLWGWDCSSPLPCCSGCCTQASQPPGVGGRAYTQPASSPLVFAQSLVLWVDSLVIPWFGLLSHVSSLTLSSGHSGPVLTLRTDDAACASLPCPCSPEADVSIWATSLLAVAVRHVFCGLFPPPFSWLCCPLRFQNSPQTHLWEGSYCVETSPPSWLPPQDGSLSLNLLSLFLSFIFCPISFRREWAALLDAWCPLPVFRSCFVEVAQHSNDLLMNL